SLGRRTVTYPLLVTLRPPRQLGCVVWLLNRRVAPSKPRCTDSARLIVSIPQANLRARAVRATPDSHNCLISANSSGVHLRYLAIFRCDLLRASTPRRASTLRIVCELQPHLRASFVDELPALYSSTTSAS